MTRGHHHHRPSGSMVEIIKCRVYDHSDPENLRHSLYGAPCFNKSHVAFRGRSRQVVKCDLCWDPAVKNGLTCRSHSAQLVGSGRVVHCLFCGRSQRVHKPGFPEHAFRILVDLAEVGSGRAAGHRSKGVTV